MDISARAASHFIKAANYYKNIDFFNSINYFYNFYLKLACMTQILNLYFFNRILITHYIPKVSKGTENKLKMKILYIIK